MPEETPKPKRQRNRTKEYAQSKVARILAAEKGALSVAETAAEILKTKLSLLEQKSKNKPTDADGDIDFAYRNMALETVDPLDAPSTAAWSWYVFARLEPNEFLKICHKREDQKAKIAGTITNQRMEDDKRKQFAILDRIEQQLTIDVKEIVRDLMSKFSDDVLHEARKFKDQWASYFERFPL